MLPTWVSFWDFAEFAPSPRCPIGQSQLSLRALHAAAEAANLAAQRGAPSSSSSSSDDDAPRTPPPRAVARRGGRGTPFQHRRGASGGARV
jgi:hypothetical protein